MSKRRLLLWIALFLPVGLQASTDNLYNNKEDAISLNEHVEYFLDQDGQLGLEDIVLEYNKGKFSTNNQKVANFTGLEGTIWFRFKISNQTKVPLYVAFSNIFIEEIDLYSIVGVNHFQGEKTGFLFPFNSRALPLNRYMVEIPESGNQNSIVVYVSLRNNSKPPMILSLQVGSMKALSAQNRYSEFISVAVLGVLLVMLFYNLCLWTVIQDSLYLYYCVYLLTATICVLWFNGFLFEWFWPNHPSINPYPWPMGLIYWGQLFFVNRLLNIRHELKPIYPFSWVLYSIALLICCSAWLPYSAYAAITFIGGITIPLYFLVAALLLKLRKVRMANIFLLGWCPILVVTILNILMVLNLLPYNLFFDTHAVELTLSWEVVIFSLALGYRYNLMKEEKLDIQTENLKILSEQKKVLRKLVFERTEEILSQNEQLVRNQEQIKIQNERLATQNKAYGRLREIVLKQNQNLEQAVKKRTIDLANSNHELKKIIQKIEQFSYITAHNLRGPVARILGLTALIDKDKIGSTENRLIVERLHVSAKDLDAIIHDLGTILAVQQSKTDKFVAVNFEKTVRKTLSVFSKEINALGIQIELDCSFKSMETIPSCLENILSNILSNSIKYRTESQTPIISIKAEEEGGKYKLVVEDNGIGFESDAFADKLFEPFQRFHTHKEGKGLGLFQIKTQVTFLGGSINLWSKVNRGTRIEITLPKKNQAVLVNS